MGSWDEPRGRLLGDRYLLEERIARGGTSSIWRAQHVVLGRAVAVKLLEPCRDPGARTDELLRETRVAASIRHRHVVQIVDFGTTPEGQPYMVMELLVGRSLARRLAEPVGLSLDESVRLIARMLAGLAAVHEAGIVHRDVKPENVFLVREGDSEYPKVIDFGISRAAREHAPIAERGIVGTPRYMSPEQARGVPDLDARTDVWSAGVILYELLTGRGAYELGRTGEVLLAIQTRDPVPLAGLRPDLPRELVAVVERAMSRDRSRRPADAGQLRRELLSAVRGFVGESTGAHALAHAADSFTPFFDRSAVRRALRDVERARTDPTDDLDGAPTTRSDPPRASRPLRRLALGIAATALVGALAALGWWTALRAPAAPEEPLPAIAAPPP